VSSKYVNNENEKNEIYKLKQIYKQVLVNKYFKHITT